MNKLTCPVCERSQIEADICPNCETDLSTYRMLSALPKQTYIANEEKKSFLPFWLPIGIAVLFLLLGLSLGIIGNSVIAKQPTQIIESSAKTSSSLSTVKTNRNTFVLPAEFELSQELAPLQSDSCGGFNYIVRRGDSLSLIAARFYGNSHFWSSLGKANPKLQNQGNLLKIGEMLFVPNLKSTCYNS